MSLALGNSSSGPSSTMSGSAIAGGSLSAGSRLAPPVHLLSCDNEVKIVKFRYNFLIHNIFERINGELEKLIKVGASVVLY